MKFSRKFCLFTLIFCVGIFSAFPQKKKNTIGYAPTNQNRDGFQRKLTVEVKNGENSEKRNALIRDGFTVPEEK